MFPSGVIAYPSPAKIKPINNRKKRTNGTALNFTCRWLRMRMFGSSIVRIK